MLRSFKLAGVMSLSIYAVIPLGFCAEVSFTSGSRILKRSYNSAVILKDCIYSYCLKEKLLTVAKYYILYFYLLSSFTCWFAHYSFLNSTTHCFVFTQFPWKQWKVNLPFPYNRVMCSDCRLLFSADKPLICLQVWIACCLSHPQW